MNYLLRNSFTFAFLLVLLFLTEGLAQEPAPAFELTDHTGRSQRLEDYRGRIVVLNF